MRTGLSPNDAGLSPRMRGSHVDLVNGDSVGGPIPAHAGEPTRLVARKPAVRAYPRACGGAR